LSIPPDGGLAGGAGSLAAFRAGFYECLSARADVLFELLCQSGPVASLPVLALVGIFTADSIQIYQPEEVAGTFVEEVK